MAQKPLVIDTEQNSQLVSDLNKWHALEQQDKFIGAIETAVINDDSGDVSSMVSGIPTVFARVNLFRSAIAYFANNPGELPDKGNISAYYKQLNDEWRGLVAAIACDYTNFSVRRVDLEYTDGLDISETKNIYEPKGAFGNMLMVGRAKWCDPQTGVPFIDIIKYGNQVVGGSSPDTMVFTSIAYSLKPNPEHPWSDSRTGKFTDPVASTRLNSEQLRTIYTYVGYLLRNLDKVASYFNEIDAIKRDESLQVNYSQLNNFMQAWRDEMVKRAEKEGWVISGSSIPAVNIFNLADGRDNQPYSTFFNYQNKLWAKDGNFYENYIAGGIEFNPKELLLPQDSEITRIILNPGVDVDTLPVYLLRASQPGTTEPAYFALPLTAKALKVFGKSLSSFIGGYAGMSDIKSELTAEFDEEANRLEVSVKIVNADNDNYQIIKCGYEINPANFLMKEDIIIWPNFVSPSWNRYFLYSELPHNVVNREFKYRAVPFVADIRNDLSIIEENDEPMLLANGGEITAKGEVEAKLLTIAKDENIDMKSYKYEIYESNRPFKGVELNTQNGKKGGYLIINYAESPDRKPYTITGNPRPVKLGLDFGSTNTSLAYFDEMDPNAKASPFTFRNMRVSLFGNNAHTGVAKPNELFFFPNVEVGSNAVKSMLTLHNEAWVKREPSETRESMLATEVRGGFPCFVRNLPVQNVSTGKISLNIANCKTVEIVNDMKWTPMEEDKSHKKAFLRTLMLQTYAELFTRGYVPTSVRWSYPSAMSRSLLGMYNDIWSGLKQISPVLDYNNGNQKFPLEVATVDNSAFFANGTGGFGQHASGQTQQPQTQQGGFGQGGFGQSAGFGQAAGFGGQQTGFGGQQAGFGGQQAGFGGQAQAGFGAQQPQQPAQPAAQTDSWEIEDTTKPISFKPRKLFSQQVGNSIAAISEACAVANFISTGADANTGANVINLCFDIGGSTTDITALCQLAYKDETPATGMPNGFGTTGGMNSRFKLTMIKQNSIRFAAMLVSKATEYSPNFRNVLLEVCHECGLKIEGLKSENSSYSPKTAPYYFEQVVDRLKPEQLPIFYAKLMANCQELVCANLYVTGMIMFYAGQLCAKMVNQLKRSNEKAFQDTTLPLINIKFAGKGSRLFEWWSTTNPQAAYQYYIQMLQRGMGPEGCASVSGVNLPLKDTVNENVKYEVSMGLAKSTTDLYEPTANSDVEIIGENGFVKVGDNFEMTPLPANHILTNKMMSELDNTFTLSYDAQPCQQFYTFCDLYYQVAAGLFNLQFSEQQFMDAFQNMNIVSYIKDRPEYRFALSEYVARRSKQFDYVSPIIILEATKFYEEHLMPTFMNRKNF